MKKSKEIYMEDYIQDEIFRRSDNYEKEYLEILNIPVRIGKRIFSKKARFRVKNKFKDNLPFDQI